MSSDREDNGAVEGSDDEREVRKSSLERRPSSDREGSGAGRDADKDDSRPAEEFKIFVGGISWHMNDRELKDTFRKYGATDARVMLDRTTNRSRGFGFVHFSNKKDLEKAVTEMHDNELDGRKISVTRAVPQNAVNPGTPAAVISRGDRGYAGRESRRSGYSRYPERYPERGYADRGGHDMRYADYDRGYDRREGYGGYSSRDPYAREPYRDRYAGYDSYDRGYPPGYGYERDMYPPRDPYARDRYDGYADRYPAERRPAERYYEDRRPDRDYGRYDGGGSSRPAPYERSRGGSRGDDRPPGML